MWQDALIELNREGKINGSTNRASILVNGEPKQSYQEEVVKFGATVMRRQQRDFTDNCKPVFLHECPATSERF